METEIMRNVQRTAPKRSIMALDLENKCEGFLDQKSILFVLPANDSVFSIANVVSDKNKAKDIFSEVEVICTANEKISANFAK